MSLRLGLCTFAIATSIAALLQPPTHGDVVLYNHSPSMPIGFYARISAPPARGEIVTVRAVDAAPAEARRRHFDRPSDRFLKRVAAIAGDRVCAEGQVVAINGQAAVQRQDRDSHGHVLPHWKGCRTLKADELLLLGDATDSFDGRYWGVISARLIEGVWRPLGA